MPATPVFGSGAAAVLNGDLEGLLRTTCEIVMCFSGVLDGNLGRVGYLKDFDLLTYQHMQPG
jgi:hypothetical protein